MSENTVAEYFAGIGLMRLGLEAAGWRVVFANDISPRKRAMYAAAFPNDAHFHPGDIFLLDHNLVPSATLATCSFPCTDLSLAGNYAGLAGRASSAFRGWIEILQAQGDAAPPLVLLENVVGWLSSNKGQDFRLTIKALNDLGYACDVFTLNALHFVPQSRPRVFVVGSRRHMPAASIVPALARSPALISPRLKQTLQDNSDLCWLWLDIPEPPPLHTAGLAAIIEPDQRWWADADIARHLAMMTPAHQHIVYQLRDSLFISYRTGFRRMRDGKQRLEVRSDEIAGCLRTASGGSARQIVIEAGMGRVRMRFMSPREYARLQGVPDAYPITVRENDALTGFGDAVCVPLITWIGQHVLAQAVDKVVAP